MMNVQQCRDVVRLEHLPTQDFIGWSDSEKNQFCKHYYNLLDHHIYDWNPYTQGELLCESMGIPEHLHAKKLRDIKESFEMHFEDKIEELLRCSFSV